MNKLNDISVAIIDDDASLCRALGRLLRVSGVGSVPYASAEQFLADDNKPRFDCLLVDIQLEGMTGIELSQRLSASGSTTPLIFITANDEPAVYDQAVQGGCAEYLHKTDAGHTVLAAIQRAIKHP